MTANGSVTVPVGGQSFQSTLMYAPSTAVILALLTVLFIAGATPTLTTGARPWPTDHSDNRRSGSDPSGALFRRLARHWGRGLDGAVYRSPIAMGGYVVV